MLIFRAFELQSRPNTSRVESSQGESKVRVQNWWWPLDHPTSSAPGRHVVILLGVFPEEQLWSTLTSVCQPTCDISVHGRSDRYVSTSTRETDRCNGTSHLQALQIIPSQAFSRDRRYTSPRINTYCSRASGPTKQQIASRRLIHFTQASASRVLRGRQTPLCPRQKGCSSFDDSSIRPDSARLSHVTTVVYQLDSCTHFCHWVHLDRHRVFVGTKTAHSNPQCFNAMFTCDPQTAHIPTSPLNPSHDH